MDIKWYVLQTPVGREEEAAELLIQKIDHALWDGCRILKKQQLFRIKGKYVLSRKDMFPGYIFIHTEYPEELAKALYRAKKFPQPVGGSDPALIPVKEEDLRFLQSVCGSRLEHEMPLSLVTVDKEGKILNATGVLAPYLRQLSRQRLRLRYVTAGVSLFNRREDILFGIRLAGDEIRDG